MREQFLIWFGLNSAYGGRNSKAQRIKSERCWLTQTERRADGGSNLSCDHIALAIVAVLTGLQVDLHLEHDRVTVARAILSLPWARAEVDRAALWEGGRQVGRV
jgi:hypothetical protein